MKNYSTKILSLTLFVLALSQQAAASTKSLLPFEKNNGQYMISPDSGPYCMKAYSQLIVSVDAYKQIVTTTFVGDGKMHGLPTAGTFTLDVNPENITQVPHFPLPAYQRTILIGRNVVIQETTSDTRVWNNLGVIFSFTSDNSVMVYKMGFNCLFLRSEGE